MGKTSKMIVLFVGALIIRLLSINQSLWLDEAIGAIAAKNYSYIEIVKTFITHDNHPPLYYWLLKLWTGIFGYSDISIRLPGVIIGALCVALIYRITSRHSPKIAVLASLLVAISPFMVYYSHEARMYILASLFTLLSVFSFLETFGTNYKKLWWVLFSVSITGLMFTDYMPVFMLPVFPLYAYFQRQNRVWCRYFILSFLPLIVFGVMWIPTFVTQIQGGSVVLQVLPEWRSIAGGATVKQAALVWTKFILGRISVNPKTFYGILIAIFSIPAAYSLLKGFFKGNRFIIFVELWLIVPLVLSFLTSFLFPAFEYFRFTFLAPAFFILVANGVVSLKSQKATVISGLLIILGSITGLGIYLIDQKQWRENWGDAVSYVQRDATAGSIALFEFPESFAPYRWYSDGTVPGIGGLSEIKAQEGDNKLLGAKLESATRVYYFEYLHDLTDPKNIILTELPNLGFSLKREIASFHGVGTIKIWERN